MKDMRDTVQQLERTQHELVIAKKAAEDAAKTKAEFLHNMSHEIRTPFNGVLGVAALLAETQLTDEQRDMLHTIQLSGEHLLSILNDILDFSKYESGKLSLESRPLDLAETLEQSIELAFKPVKGKKVDIVYHFHSSVPKYIYGDVTRLRQICTNLINNAYKYSSKGTIIIRVSLVEVNDADGMHTIQIDVSGR